MKFLLNALFTACSFLCLSAQTFDVETIKYSGDNNKRINLVVLGDGYQVTELDQFINDASRFTNTIFNTSPLKEYEKYFNVYAIKVISNESGVDHPATAEDEDESGAIPELFDTYFNATFDAYKQHRLLFYGIDESTASHTEMKITNVLIDNFPSFDSALILVNTSKYGGSGGRFPIVYNGYWGPEVALHELGHSLFNLKDEYYPGDSGVGEAINMTQESNPNLVKWKNWVGTNGVDLFPYGTSKIASTWYKPRHQECKMEAINKPFCAVCQEGIIEKIHDILSPIESYIPNNNTIDNPSFPLDFTLNLIKPEPNTLVSTWRLNGVNIAQNVDILSLNEIDLVIGKNILTTAIIDDTALLKVDNHNSTHVSTITWIINYNTLGIEDITSTSNTFDISMHPNPTTYSLNLKIESHQDIDLKVEIISLDGKKVKSAKISKDGNKQLNISHLSQGVYIVNFYADKALIAHKKLVKK